MIAKLFIAIGLIAALAVAPTAMAQSSLGKNDIQHYKNAFQALDRGRLDDALAFARRAEDKTLAKAVRGEVMGQPGTPLGFADIVNFIEDNRDWPGMDDLRRMAEETMPDDWPNQQKVNWYTSHPALSLHGFYHQIDAQLAMGLEQQAVAQIRARWVNNGFTRDELQAFYGRFNNYLRPDDHWARLDRLIWDENYETAQRMYPFVSSDLQALAEARIAYGRMDSRVASLITRVPRTLQNDPGLLYERLRWLRMKSRDDEAVQILLHAPADLGRPEKWWVERHIVIRRLIELRDINTAMQVARNHGQTSGLAHQQAEFMAGWLALRFFKNPQEAVTHFTSLYNGVSTPISKSRGAYWLGRSYEFAKDQAQARQWYEAAAAMITTFYGQLAHARIYPTSPVTLNEPVGPKEVSTKFLQHDLVRAAWQLRQIGQNERMEKFFLVASDTARQRGEYVALAKMAQRMNRLDLMVKAAKDANQKDISLPVSGFPLLEQKLPSQPEAAMIHAIIRQESMFKRDAVSPAGARGIMQLMPTTARAVARKLGIKFNNNQLFDTAANIRMGSAYLQERLEGFDGSLPLAIAAYNAGQGRAREWLGIYGDPRNPQIDPIDWIELIPIYETRNYVHRVMEALQIYRIRLNGAPANLRIMQDLRP
jgi:soluble lytic murein transglycosylase